jgi:hypothetical protein
MGLQAYFLTLTLPSRFHPNPVYRDHRTWTPQYSPRVADREIKRRWRAFCRNVQKAKRGIPLLGIKMIEGHKDGCPHVHAILYLPEGKSDEVDAILQRYFPEPVEGQRVATKFVHIDPAAGATPTTYLMKYLLKTVNVSPEEALRDGVPELAGTATVNNPEIAIEEHEKEDENGDTANESEQGAHLENFERHLALANERRWRRYSTLGTHGMQRLWQRLYNLRQPPENAPEHAQEAWNAMFDAFPENFRAAWLAMQDRDWGTVVIELGALQQKVLDHADGRIPARPRVRLEYVTEETTPEGETRPLLNQYGETIKRAEFIAVEGDAWRLPVRAKKWTIGKLSDLKQPVADGADSGETEKVSENRGVAYGDSYPSSPPAVVSKCVDPTDPALEYGRKMVAQTRHKADANLRKLVGDRWGWPDWEEWIARTVQIYPDLADVIA